VYGRERIARLLPGFGTWLELLGAEEMRFAEVNGQPGALFLGHDGRAVLIVSLDIADGLVQTIHAITNPEKLRHLDPMARRPRPLAR
jgi:RNA polymerase sigma-70 factor (ECF subfamily)